MNFNKLFNHRAKNIASAAFILGIAGFISDFLSLIRLSVFTTLFKTSDLDIFFAAFRIPDLLYNILILGAISTALIPVFSEHWLKSKKDAWQLYNNILCIFISLLILSSIVLAIFAPQLMRLITPGFEKEKMAMVVKLTRIMFLSPILLGISNIFGSVLQYFSKFLTYSLAPIMYNIGIIFGAIVFTPKIGIIGLALGVLLGAVLHLLIQLPALFLSGYHFQFVFNFRHRGIRKIFKLMIPRAIGLAAQQINLIVITAIASMLVAGSISLFNVSNDLQQVPVSLFGTSFAIAAFPSLSRSFSEKKKKEFIEKIASIASQVLFFLLPLSVLFFLLRAQIVRIILGRQNFTWADTRLAGACLGIFSISIFAQGLINLLSRAFYAAHDTRTPVKITIFSIILNIILSVFFVSTLSQQNSFFYYLITILDLQGLSNISIIGFPLAFSLSSIFNLILLLVSLKKKIGNEWDLKLGNVFLRLFLLSIISGLITFGLLNIFSLILNLKTFLGIFLQAIFAGGTGAIFYIYLAKILKFPEYKLISKNKEERFPR